MPNLKVLSVYIGIVITGFHIYDLVFVLLQRIPASIWTNELKFGGCIHRGAP